jgi:hypothetical protein
MKHAKSLTLATAGAATLAMSNTPVLAESLGDLSLDLSAKDISMVDKSLHSGCEQPANRDVHSVLSSFEGDTDGDYKFSGCGSAI